MPYLEDVDVLGQQDLPFHVIIPWERHGNGSDHEGCVSILENKRKI
jgi:hypothetical protein